MDLDRFALACSRHPLLQASSGGAGLVGGGPASLHRHLRLMSFRVLDDRR